MYECLYTGLFFFFFVSAGDQIYYSHTKGRSSTTKEHLQSQMDYTVNTVNTNIWKVNAILIKTICFDIRVMKLVS